MKDTSISRRDFLKIAGISLGVAFTPILPKVLKDITTTESKIELFGQDKIVSTPEEFRTLYAKIEADFDAKLSPEEKLLPSWDQRATVYGKNVRALEIIVPQHKFDSNFSLRMQQQVDLLNRIFKNASVDLKTRLLRIIVVSDLFTSYPNGPKFAKDVDHSEFIGDEPENDHLIQLDDVGGNLHISKLDKDGEKVGTQYNLPFDFDSLTGANNIVLSYYLEHELKHRIGNVPDLSVMEIRRNRTAGFLFQDMMIEENLNEPFLSGFTALVARWKKDLGVRGSLSHPLSTGTSQEKYTWMFKFSRPNKITLNIPGAESISIFTPIMQGGYYPNKNVDHVDKIIPNQPDQNIDGDKIIFNRQLLKSTIWHEPLRIVDEKVDTKGANIEIVPPVYIIRAVVNNDIREIHLPVAAFIASREGGNLTAATYKINFADTPTKKDINTLNLDMVNTSSLHTYIIGLKQQGIDVYATMKVDGTDIFFVWFQRTNKIAMKPLDKTNP